MNAEPTLRLPHLARLEQLWPYRVDSRGAVADEYNFNWRVRTQMQVLYPPSKRLYAPGILALMLAHEVLLGIGKEIVYTHLIKTV